MNWWANRYLRVLMWLALRVPGATVRVAYPDGPVSERLTFERARGVHDVYGGSLVVEHPDAVKPLCAPSWVKPEEWRRPS